MAEAQFDEDIEPQSEDEQENARRLQFLEGIAQIMMGMRTEAVQGRATCGIEEEWAEDIEFYEGIDDANRHEAGGGYRSKPGRGGHIEGDDEDNDSTSSTVFPNITRPYCDAAAARVGDMLLPTDDRAWQLKPTPIPELIEIAEALPTQAEKDEVGLRYDNEPAGPERDAAIKHDLAALTRDRLPKDIQAQVDGEATAQFGNEPDYQERLDQSYLDLADSIEEDMKVARKGAEAAERRIDDWHVECQFHTHMRDVIQGCAKVGTGVAKGPIPVRKQQVAYKGGNLIVKQEIKPCTFSVDVRNCFPDPSCGESIHNGQYHWEKDDITTKSLMKLRGQPNYIDEMIDQVLTEGPMRVVREVADTQDADGLAGLARRDKKNLYEIWYGYANITREDAEGAGVDIPDEMGEHPLIPVDVTMVNNHIIKLKINALDTGDFPYDYMVWQKRSGLPYGMGVARQLRTPQRIMTAALRNLMDNAGLAGGPMWVYLEGVMTPIDGVPELRPRKGWMLNAEALNDPKMIEYALRYIDMPMKTNELMAIIDMAMKMAEDVTGLPSLMQGSQGSAPDTVGGMTILNNNASTVLRRIARLFDDKVTEPHVRRYYTYLLQYGENDEEKAEFVIDARGSSALIERDINNQAIQQLGAMVSNPVFGIDPKKWIAEWLKSQRLDVRRFEFTDEEWRETVEKLMASAEKPDTRVEVAEIQATVKREIEAQKNAIKEAELALSVEESQQSKVMQTQKEALDREVLIALKAVDSELSQIKEGKIDERTANQIKGRLAEAAMKIQAQLSVGDTEIAAPPVEPAGRAPDGESYEK